MNECNIILSFQNNYKNVMYTFNQSVMRVIQFVPHFLKLLRHRQKNYFNDTQNKKSFLEY